MDLQPYHLLAKAYADLDAEQIIGQLSDDCVYESQMVLEPLIGREAIAAYLRIKFETIRDSGQKIVAEVRTVPCLANQPCVILGQYGDFVAVVLASFIDSGKISRIDLCVVPGPTETRSL